MLNRDLMPSTSYRQMRSKMATPLPAATISMEAACIDPGCSEMAWKLYRKLDTPNYTKGVSILPVPSSIAEWRAAHRTARKRADRRGDP